jgi:protein-tyrosine-phosphatase
MADVEGHVLVLCPGNTCRSPFFRAILAPRLRLEVRSAAYLTPSAGVSSEAKDAARGLADRGEIDGSMLADFLGHLPRNVEKADLEHARFAVLIDETPERFRKRCSGEKGKVAKQMFDQLLASCAIRFIEVADDAFEFSQTKPKPPTERIVALYERQQRTLLAKVQDVIPYLERWRR